MATATVKNAKINVTAPNLEDVLKHVQALGAALEGTVKTVEKLNGALSKTSKVSNKIPKSVQNAIDSTTSGVPGAPVVGLDRGTAAGKQNAGGKRGDTRDFARQAQGMGGLVHIYATFAANIYAVTAAFNALSKAADFSNMTKAADILSSKLGTSINAVAKDIKTLTGSAVSAQEALTAANLAATAGLTADQIRELTKVAKGASIALGRDMTDALTRVFRGTIKIEPELLDELGLMVKIKEATDDYGRSIGKSASSLTDFERRMAFVNAVAKQGTEKFSELNATVESNPYSKLSSALSDLVTTHLVSANSLIGTFVNALASSPTALLMAVGAIVSLLIRQAIPAIKDMGAAWAEADQQQKKLLEKSKLRIEGISAPIKKSIEDSKKALNTFISARDNVEKTFNSKTNDLLRFAEIRSATKLAGGLIDLEPDKVAKQAQQIMRSIDTVYDKTEKRIEALQNKFNKGIGTEADGKEFFKRQEQLAGLDRLRTATEPLAAAATASAAAKGFLTKNEQELKALEARNKRLARKITRAESVSTAVEKTEALGFASGMRSVWEEVNKSTTTIDAHGNAVAGTGKQYKLWERASIGVRGTLGVMTTSLARVFSALSIWLVVIPLVIMAFKSLGEWIANTTENTENLASQTEAATKALADLTTAREKLATSVNTKEIFELEASQVSLLVDAYGRLKELQPGITDMRNSSGFSRWWNNDEARGIGTNILDSLKTTEDKDKLLEALKSQGIGSLEEARIVGLKLSKAGMPSVATLDKANNIISALTSLGEPAKELAETFARVKEASKELSVESQEYANSLAIQSKEAKMAGGVASMAAGSLKIFSESGSLSGVTNSIEQIGSAFQAVVGIQLPNSIKKVQQEVIDLNANYAFASKALDAIENPALREASKKSLKANYDEQAKAILPESATRDFLDYTYAATKALNNLALAASRAAIAKIKENKAFEAIATIARLLGGKNNLLLAKAEQARDARLAAIEKGALKTGASAARADLNYQRSNLIRVLLESAKVKVTRGPLAEQATDAMAGLKPDDPIYGELYRARDAYEASKRDYDLHRAEAAKIDASKDSPLLMEAKERLATIADMGVDDSNLTRKKSEEASIALAKEQVSLIGTYTTLQSAAIDYSAALRTASDTTDSLSKEEARLEVARTMNEGYLKSGDKGVVALAAAGLEQVVEDEASLARRKEQAQLDRALATRQLDQSIADKRLETNNKQLTLLEKHVEYLENTGDYIMQTSRSFKEVANVTTSIGNTLRATFTSKLSMAAEYFEKYYSDITKMADDSAKSVEASAAIKDIDIRLLEVKIDILESSKKSAEQIRRGLSLSMKQNENYVMTGKATANQLAEFKANSTQVLVNYVYDTMGATKSVTEQVLVGTVDAFDTITDNLTEMIQKSKETALTWVSIRDMIRNTFSDMFRNIASDYMKNAIKDGILKLVSNITGKEAKSTLQLEKEKYERMATPVVSKLEEIRRLLAGESVTINDGKAYPEYDAYAGTRESLPRYGLRTYGIKLTPEVTERELEGNEGKYKGKAYQDLVIAQQTDKLLDESLRRYEAIKAMSESTSTPIMEYNPFISKPDLLDNNASVLEPILAEFKTDMPKLTRSLVDNSIMLRELTNAILRKGNSLMNASSTDSLGYYKDGMDSGKTAEELSAAAAKSASSVKTQAKASGTFMDSVKAFGDTGTIFNAAVGGLIGALVSGGSARGALAGVATGAASSLLTSAVTKMFSFANGGVMSSAGNIPLRAYSSGGVASSPQLALFGEGSKNEAFVPLPDNKRIPVMLSGNTGMSVGDTTVNVTVNNNGGGRTDTSIDVEAAKKLSKSMAATIKAAIQEELIKQSKPNGILYGR